MKIKLQWHLTQDYLLFDVINPELVEWFVLQSNHYGNDYANADMITDLPLRGDDPDILISEISQAIDYINIFLIKLKIPTFVKPNNWYDQNELNRLHKDWATSRKLFPRLPELLFKVNKTAFDCYQQTNCHIHLIEKSFLFSLRAKTTWRQPNPFKDQFYNWENCHLWITYPGHGREAFEKFQNLDDNLEDIEIDNCNWDNIDSFFRVTLRRPFQYDPPKEFLDWCKERKLVPHQNHIPLGNLCDWRNTLTPARVIMSKNIKIPNNLCSLSLIE
jgi:hypothetical protein